MLHDAIGANSLKIWNNDLGIKVNQVEIQKVIKHHFYPEEVNVPMPHASEKKTLEHLRRLGDEGRRGRAKGRPRRIGLELPRPVGLGHSFAPSTSYFTHGFSRL